QRAIGCARACRADAVAIHGLSRCREDLRVERQAEVVVRPEHQGPASPDHDFRGAQDLVDREVAWAGGLGPQFCSSCDEGAQLLEKISRRRATLDHETPCRLRAQADMWTSVPAVYRSRSSTRRSLPLVVRPTVPLGTR